MGPQTAAALRAWQRAVGLPETGSRDAATREQLRVTAPVLTTHLLREEELVALSPLPPTWLEKSQQSMLGYANALEFVAERFRASPRLVRRLNPAIDWDAVRYGRERPRG